MGDEVLWQYFNGKFWCYHDPEQKPLEGRFYYRRDDEGRLYIEVEAHNKDQTYTHVMYAYIVETKRYKPGLHRISKVMISLGDDNYYIVPDKNLPIKDDDDITQVISFKKLLGLVVAWLAVFTVLRMMHTEVSFLGGFVIFLVCSVLYIRFVGFEEPKFLCVDE